MTRSRILTMRRLAPVAGALAVGCGSAGPDPVPPVIETVAAPEAPAPQPAAEPDDGLIEDDGRTLWASPTAGSPIDLSVVPEGSQLVLHLRPTALLAREEGRRVWRALGPAVAGATLGADQPLDQVESVVLGVSAGASYGEVSTTVRVDPEPTDDLPLLQREIEQLIDTSDSDRHATLVFSPRFLLGDGGALLQGPWEPLRELLLAQTRDAWSAAAISLHLDADDRLYWELRVLASAAEPPTRLAGAVLEQATAWQGELATVVEAGPWSPYSAAVLARSPRMLGVLGKYARRGVADRQAVVNGYLPAGAGHQLALAAERLVAELAAPPVTTLAASEATERPLTLDERLRRPVTISFARESLETAVGILSDTLGVPVEIRGRDLQLEGITRNQMLALDVAEVTAADALVRMLRRANPDPLATGPDDPRQRLVYLLDDTRILITTRSAAEKRGAELPAVFIAN